MLILDRVVEFNPEEGTGGGWGRQTLEGRTGRAWGTNPGGQGQGKFGKGGSNVACLVLIVPLSIVKK